MNLLIGFPGLTRHPDASLVQLRQACNTSGLANLSKGEIIHQPILCPITQHTTRIPAGLPYELLNVGLPRQLPCRISRSLPADERGTGVTAVALQKLVARPAIER